MTSSEMVANLSGLRGRWVDLDGKDMPLPDP